MRLIHNSLHDDVANQLRERIFGAQLAPGSFIDEAVLCEEMAISRTPLREALKVLAAEGLVRHEPRRGSFVNQVTEQDLDECIRVSIWLLKETTPYTPLSTVKSASQIMKRKDMATT